MNYKELHLEAVMIPANIEELLAGESMWDMEVPPFSISIVEAVYEGADRMTWSIEFSPAFDFDDLNERLEGKGFGSDGKGWTEYILKFISTHYPKAKDRIKEDSSAGTCCLYTFTKSDFTALLKIVSESIRDLYCK